jgi:hypothetical protein
VGSRQHHSPGRLRFPFSPHRSLSHVFFDVSKHFINLQVIK